MPFAPWIDDPADVHAHRRPVLWMLLWFTVVFGCFFAALNLYHGSYGLMVAELVMVAFALALLRIVRRTHHLARWTLVYLLPFYGVMMYALHTALASPAVFAWVLLIPILSHLLLGRLIGGAVSIGFMLIAGAIFFSTFGLDPAYGNARSVANVALAAVCIFGFSHVYETSRVRAETRLREMALTDPLTGLANRARLAACFDSEKERGARTGARTSLLMIDLDHFKAVNDRYGHEAGDAVLRFVAATLQTQARATDMVCRLGGEEFCVLLSDTAAEQARTFAERLRTQIESAPCEYAGHTIPLTMSIGIAELGVDADMLDPLLRRADRRLYEAKLGGRNRVVG